MNIHRLLKSLLIVGLGIFVVAGSVSAHVTVNPREATVGYSVATVRVPNEKDVPTTSVRMLVPEGVTVNSIKPVPGWTATFVREEQEAENSEASEGDHGHENATGRVTEVIWSGGLINPGEFQEFPMSVQYTKAGEVTWKGYQTYQDGEIVPWDGSSEDHPASQIAIAEETKIDTLSNSVQALSENQAQDPTKWLSVVAILLSGAALFISLRKK